jgi:hypothetical protein
MSGILILSCSYALKRSVDTYLALMMVEFLVKNKVIFKFLFFAT